MQEAQEKVIIVLNNDEFVIEDIIKEEAEQGADSNEEPKKKHSIWKTILLILGILLIGAYVGGAIYYDTHFLPATSIYGTDVSGLNEEQAESILKKNNRIESINITGRDNTEATLDLAAADAYVKYLDISGLMHYQDRFLWFIHMQDDKKLEPLSEIAYSFEGLKNDLSKLSLLSEDVARRPEDAGVAYSEEDSRFYVKEEDNGTTLIFDKLADVVAKKLEDYPAVIDIGEADCYENAEQKVTERMTKEALVLNNFSAVSISLDMGAGVTETIDGRQFIELFGGDRLISGIIDSNAEPVLDEALLRSYIKELAEKYDTSNGDRLHPFVDHRKVTRWIETDYGWELDQETTFNTLKKNLDKMAHGKRLHSLMEYHPTIEAIWSRRAASHGKVDYGTRYVEADLTNQHVYVFDNGELLWESDCVSGLYVAKGRRTPEGIDNIDAKARNKVLRGYKRDGTIDYESPVAYWMPFNKGIGLHDASWRNKFGGNIYYYSGSHGCINLPRAKAKTLYDLVEVDMAVITYY